MSSCSFTCSNLLCEFLSCELPGLRIYFAICVQRFLHQAICIHHRKSGVYIHEISGELSMDINFIFEMLLLLWLYNLSLNWPGSCPQPAKVSEGSQLGREAWAQYCPSTNNTCLSPEAETSESADISVCVQDWPSIISPAQGEMISQSQKRGRMQRMQAAVMRTNCWVSLPGSVLQLWKANHLTAADIKSTEWGISCFPKYPSH